MKILVFLILLFSVQLSAQTYPVTGITISLPPNPDASFTKMGNGTLMLSITASAKQVNGRIDPRLESSNILVTIKKGGAKICGSYTSSSAPSANFNSPTKVWSGNNAVSLLGQDCTLPPGDYEFCVQFFAAGPVGIIPISEEKCKSFTIRPVEQQNYQAPQAISPTDGTILKEIDLKKSINFRWTPIIPKPKDPVTYHIRVWQLMEGQNRVQVIKSNPPIVATDVDNTTMTYIFNNLNTGPCKPPYLCDFIWTVQALDREGKPIGGNNGTSEVFRFTVQPVNDPPSIVKLLMPKNGSILSSNENPMFTWTNFFPGDYDGDGYYKIKIVEIKGDQSPEDALATNKPFFEKDSLIRPSLEYPTSAPKFESGKKYAWRVQPLNKEGKLVGENNRMSIIFSFNITDNQNNSVAVIQEKKLFDAGWEDAINEFKQKKDGIWEMTMIIPPMLGNDVGDLKGKDTAKRHSKNRDAQELQLQVIKQKTGDAWMKVMEEFRIKKLKPCKGACSSGDYIFVEDLKYKQGDRSDLNYRWGVSIYDRWPNLMQTVKKKIDRDYDQDIILMKSRPPEVSNYLQLFQKKKDRDWDMEITALKEKIDMDYKKATVQN